MKDVSASSQDYLEAILELSSKNNRIKSVDVAEMLGVTRASTNRAMGVLKEAGLITQQRYSDICLTEKGFAEAVAVQDRHDTIRSFLIDVLGVSYDTAEKDACKMEHTLSPETFQKFKIFVNKQKQS